MKEEKCPQQPILGKDVSRFYSKSKLGHEKSGPKAKEKKDCTCPKDTDHSLTVGPRGPVLLQDSILHETLEIFAHSKPLERVVHVKGYGAFGYFQPFQSMKPYTQACFLQNPAQRTPVFVRFSLAVSNRGTPDTSRNVRGFATKFYTKEGIFDLVGNHIPVFFIRDAMRFPETIASLSPSPMNNLPDPERFWGFVARTPEATHMLTWLYSDWGTVDSLRHIRGHSVSTFVWKNAQDVRRYVKYHWLPLAGERCLNRQEALRLAGENPDIAGQDLYDTLAKGQRVEYDLCVQLMDPADEQILPYDPLDDTKIWDEGQYPLIPVGRLILDRNPDDYQCQVEKAAFSPANLIPGIELSDDKMLQGRSFIYWDAQRHRIGPNFREIPINHTPAWSPSCSLVTSGKGQYISGVAMRSHIPKPDNFSQAGEHYHCLSDVQKEHLIDNIALELYTIAAPIQNCVLDYFYQASTEFGQRVKQRMHWYANQA